MQLFSSTKQKIILGLYLFLILSIPVGAYLASQKQIFKSKASQENKISGPVTSPKPSSSPTPVKKSLSETDLQEATSAASVSFGPTLNLTLVLEGRPANNQASKIFIGIAEGTPATNPKYLLSFTIDLPASGIFNKLSLAGLTSGTKYSAFIKGPAQIATSSAFILNPSVNSLNDGQPLTLLTGDLNEDNVINSADYSIAKALFGTTPKSSNWNNNADFNKDGVINNIDLSYINKNFGKAGAAGVWYSPPPASKSATPSGNPAEGSPNGGYWLWVPQGF